MDIDLKECAEKTGKSEAEIGMAIIKLLIFKAHFYLQDQKITMCVKPKSNGER